MENTDSSKIRGSAEGASLVGGRYRLVRRLDDLGQASVYEAEQLPMGRRVALKLLDASAGLAARQRLVEAARLASRVRHPNVAAVYDVGPEADSGYLAMELCRGRPLDRLVQDSGPLAVTTLTTLGDQLLSGLEAAHDLGVIHGAIRPRYVMVLDEDKSMEVKVLGFGLSSMSDFSDAFDRAFSAPEVLAGAEPTVASDLYSAAAVLCYALCGTLPWEQDEDVGARQWYEQRLRALLAGLEETEAWVGFFSVGLAFEPQQRFSSAVQMRTALSQAEDGDWNEQSVITAAQVRVGPYRLVRLLARGGMGELHLARPAVPGALGRVVALKRVRPDLASSQDFRKRFLVEVSVTQRLSHPNIAQVFDVGHEGEDLFMAMEYVVGRDVRRILDRAIEDGIALPRDLAVFMAREVCEALAYAHRVRFDGKVGLFHGDVSPDNVVVSYEGDVKLIDFGLGFQQSGPKMGKGSYVAPEVAAGGPAGPQSDIYSVGVLLLELLTDRRPGDLGDKDPTLVLDGLVMEPERAILAKALALDPGRRYQSAGAMRDDLSVALSRLNPRMSRDRLGRFVRSLFLAEYQADVALAMGLQTEMPQDPGGRSLARSMTTVEMGSSLEGTDQEMWLDETARTVSVVGRTLTGVAVQPGSGDESDPAGSAGLETTAPQGVRSGGLRWWYWAVLGVALLSGAVLGWFVAAT